MSQFSYIFFIKNLHWILIYFDRFRTYSIDYYLFFLIAYKKSDFTGNYLLFT